MDTILNSNDSLKTKQSELHGDNLWDIAAVYTSNCDKIRRWLEETARKELRGSVAVTGQRQQNVDLAIAKYPSLSSQLEQLYDVDEIAVDHILLQKAKDGVLKRKAPTNGNILFWLFILVLTGGLELSFFSYMVIWKGGGSALIGIAVLLLAGGLMSGNGITHAMLTMHKKEEKIEAKYLVLFGVGVSLIVGIAILRGMYGGVLACVVAVLFGVAVTTAETFWGYNKTYRRHLLDDMFWAQGYYAAVQHSKDMGERNNPEDDTWRKEYIGFVHSIARTAVTATSPDTAPHLRAI